MKELKRKMEENQHSSGTDAGDSISSAKASSEETKAEIENHNDDPETYDCDDK